MEDVRLEAEPDAGFSFDALPPELAPLFLERLAFPHLLSLRLCSKSLSTLSMGVTRLTLTRCEQLYLPLLRPFVSVQSLTLEEYEAMRKQRPKRGTPGKKSSRSSAKTKTPSSATRRSSRLATPKKKFDE